MIERKTNVKKNLAIRGYILVYVAPRHEVGRCSRALSDRHQASLRDELR